MRMDNYNITNILCEVFSVGFVRLNLNTVRDMKYFKKTKYVR
jgi:hypothetical protein